MVSADYTRDSFRQRLLAVLDYDEVPAQQRVKHLASKCKCSLSTARRMLSQERDAGRMYGSRLLRLAAGLGVSHRWLYDGKFEKFDPRTARIQLVMLRGESNAQADIIIGSISSEVPGEPLYIYVGEVMSLSSAILLEQHRRLTEWEKNKNIRFMIRLANNDTKANRFLEMLSRGQLSRKQIFSMV